ncbi:UvrB/UvrC motif-containing protein [Sphingomonas sp. LY29]|uniref:UvrB/UvrC motif-containing protein n=1 Tax=Sphingomonas sp. LY29 TaxID=3095341 RepID=UPI002D77BC6D|nr:UvrB/UvrC motif-containing protein [Sphingomonas sp. LY29]WRP26629.1 UvrB/UvrC motif-containing protein [Sphingomonas sp. LY29]
MSDPIDALRQRMDAAALALDFEEAKRCRDKIAMIRGGATPAEVELADFEGIERQKPGAMGLGTSQQRTTPPPGWKRPEKPNLMTVGKAARRRRPQER